MKSAMQELRYQIKNSGKEKFTSLELLLAISELLEKEKQQIIDAFVSGCTNHSFGVEYGGLAEDYFTQKYNHKCSHLEVKSLSYDKEKCLLCGEVINKIHFKGG